MPDNYFSPGEAIADQISATVAGFRTVAALNTDEDVFNQGVGLPACFVRLARMNPPDSANRVYYWLQEWDIFIVTLNPADGRGGWRGFTEAGTLFKSVCEDAVSDFAPGAGFSRLRIIESPYEAVNKPGGFFGSSIRVRTEFDVEIDL